MSFLSPSASVPCPDSVYTGEVVQSLWHQAALPGAVLDQLSLSGTSPLLPTSFHVAVAAQSSIACAALAAAYMGELRGAPPQAVSVDMHDAERECTGLFTLEGQVPDVWAPLSGLYRCADGFVRIHANFDHHRDGALALLGLPPGKSNREQVSRALASWKKVDFETEAARQGLVVAAGRTFEEWDHHPQARFIANSPLFDIRRISDADPVSLPALDPDARPLASIRALDLTRILAGPVCGRTLAAYGADVMLVNSPNLPNIAAIADTSRGKRSALIDLADKPGRDKLTELLRGAHLFIQGYRPGGLEQLGFDPESVASIRPGIVYVSLSAYGSSGPWARRRGFDSLVQTATGFNLAEGRAAGSDLPRAMPVQILDFASGFLMAFAAQVALARQQTEGGSWHVQVSLAQTANWLRSLGRVENNFHPRNNALEAYLESYACGFGTLQAMPHAGHLSRTPTAWARPSNPPGTDLPDWTD